MYNHCVFIGNLTRDPDVRYTTSGMSVATISIAVNSKFKSGGETKEDVFFVDAVVFGAQADACGKYLIKGRQVLVDGRMRTRTWEAEGRKHYKNELIANAVKFLGQKSEKPTSGEAPEAPDEATDLEPF